MSNFIVKRSTLQGTISIPPSKSHTMRAILFGALANGKSRIENYLPAPDTEHMLTACKLLGATIQPQPNNSVEINGVNGVINAVEDVINAGNSGLILRFLTAVSAICPTHVIITGDHSIRHQRPIKPLLSALNQLGVFAVSARNDDFAPVIIRGPLKGGHTVVAGEDSQPVSSLLIACSMAEGPTEVIVRNPGEKPFVQLTLNWLERLGVHCECHNYERLYMRGNERFNAFHYTVPGDWSSAAFPLAAALVTNSALTIANVDMADPQGDKDIVFACKQMGAAIDIDDNNKSIHIKPGEKLKGTTIDVNQFIDAVPILAVLACFADGETHIVNALVARQKECDRLHAIAVELKKMGANITELEDSLIIQGGARLHHAVVHSYHDHRMAMALTVAAMGIEGDTCIEDIDCIAKTFPGFASAFHSLGANIALI